MARTLVTLLVLGSLWGCRESVEGTIVVLGDDDAGDAQQSGDVGGDDDGCAFLCVQDTVCNPATNECVECLVPEQCDLPEGYDDECTLLTCENWTCGVAIAIGGGDCVPDEHPTESGTCQVGSCVWCTDPASDADICNDLNAECGTVADSCGSLRACGSCTNATCNASHVCVCSNMECNDSCCGNLQVCDGTSGGCCTPTIVCTQSTCGSDGCNNSCGFCDLAREICNDGNCQCADQICPGGGCCTIGQVCNAQNFSCCTQTNTCIGRDCGTDGCGTSCGTCGGLETCNTGNGQCVCTYNQCNGTCCSSSGQICHFGAAGACCNEDTRSDSQVCSAASADCGTAVDNCGYARSCGACSGNDYCSTNTCIDHDVSSSACAHTSSYVWVSSAAGSAWSGGSDADANCCGDDSGERGGDYTYAADDNWNLPRSNTTVRACCALMAECVGGTSGSPSCVATGVIDPVHDTNLCANAVMYYCGNDSVCQWRSNYASLICHYDGASYFWESKSPNGSADIGTIQRQKVVVHDDKYISSSQTWGPPDNPGDYIDLWACCDDADDCVAEDTDTAVDLGRCINSPAPAGQWLCGDAGLWYECRSDSDGATMGGYICGNGSGSYLWSPE